MNTDLFLNIHDLLRVRVVQPEQRLERLIRTRLGRLLVEQPGERPHLIIRAADKLPGMRQDSRMPLQMFRSGEDQRWCAGLQKSGRPQIQLCPGSPLEIRYLPASTSMGRLWWVFLVMLRRLLMQSGNMLCHGAVLARNGQGLLIMGHRGQGKTSLCLRLLREGWDYVAEDKFILTDGVAHAFEQQIRLLPYHAKLFNKGSLIRKRLERLGSRRERMLPLQQPLLRLLPGDIADRVRSRLDRSISVRMEQLDGQGLFLEEVPIRDVALLRYDKEPAHTVTPSRGAAAFAQVQGLAFAELHALDDLFDYYSDKPSTLLSDLALSNLRDARFRYVNPQQTEDWQFLGEYL